MGIRRNAVPPLRRSSRSALLAVIAALVVVPAAHAATHTVTFDDLTAGTNVTNQYAAADGVTFNDPPLDLPVVTDAPGKAHSGTKVAELTRTCQCEDFSPYDVTGAPEPPRRPRSA